jgi:hypothetical protein
MESKITELQEENSIFKDKIASTNLKIQNHIAASLYIFFYFSEFCL